MRVGVSGDGKTVAEKKIITTPQRYKEGISELTKSAQELAKGEAVQAVAGGIAGVLSRDKSQLAFAPNLADWVGKPLQKDLSKALGVEVRLENDAALAGLGEAVAGAGQGYDIVVYLTISTGVGGARIVRKTIDERAVAFEPGQQIIDAGGALCPECAEPRTLENYVSGAAVAKRYGQAVTDIVDPAVWDMLAHRLAIGLNNTIVHWSPDIVVLGGGMMKPGGIQLARVQYYLEEVATVKQMIPKLAVATLGDESGLQGALHYVVKTV